MLLEAFWKNKIATTQAKKKSNVNSSPNWPKKTQVEETCQLKLKKFISSRFAKITQPIGMELLSTKVVLKYTLAVRLLCQALSPR